MSTGLALDSKGKRLYTTNADGELITIDRRRIDYHRHRRQ